MERLVTTTEAAKLMGLSLQGVHYRIKSGQLKSIKQAGKTFVYVTEFLQDEQNNIELKNLNIENDEKFERIIGVKDEQISLLKHSIILLKEQYKDEIKRLEKNQKRVINVFNSEIKLLKSAFNEMRSIYKQNLQIEKKDSSLKYISINSFFLFLKKHNKNNDEIKKIILTAIHNKDPRFIYNKKDKKVLIIDTDYSDLI